jgi:predicted nucleotidyltransferase
MKKPRSSKKEHLFDKKTSGDKIARVFYIDPYREFTLSEISELAGVSKSMTSTILKEMEGDGFIRIEELGKKLWRVKANIDSPDFKNWKIVNSLENMAASPITEFLIDKFRPKAIILFGSFRWGEDKKGSDIDIAVEVSEKIGFNTTSLARLADQKKEHEFAKEIRELESVIERNFQIHVFNRDDIDNNLFNNIANGIVLHGFLEVNK